MGYKKELQFLQETFKNHRLHSIICPIDSIDVTKLDLELRQIIGLKQDYDEILSIVTTRLTSRQICKLRDSFSCSYFFLILEEDNCTNLFSIGPFLEKNLERHEIIELIEKHGLPPYLFRTFEEYYGNLPIIRKDSLFHSMLHTFAEKLWGYSENYFSTTYTQGTANTYDSSTSFQRPSDQDDTLFNMQILERRYSMENNLLQAVSQGAINKVELLATQMSSTILEQRTPNTLRNLKNYSITLNTLLRKAAENGSVHPYYIDRLSSQFAMKIEQAESLEACDKLQIEMIRKYCFLVKNHSMRNFSPLIQKIIARIDFDLTSDLSLKALANLLSVNPCYLSLQFKKETGSTLTEYVNKKKIEHALLLLNTTSMQIQTIALHCGIPDLNYFTKVFKKYIHMTPKEYRASISER